MSRGRESEYVWVRMCGCVCVRVCERVIVRASLIRFLSHLQTDTASFFLTFSFCVSVCWRLGEGSVVLEPLLIHTGRLGRGSKGFPPAEE